MKTLKFQAHTARTAKAAFVLVAGLAAGCTQMSNGAGRYQSKQARPYNGPYTGEYLKRVAFPLGGIGAGMVCLDGTGSLSHVSLRNRPEVFNEPCTLAALCVKGEAGNTARVLEGPVPMWKAFGLPGSGNGLGHTDYGLPRFANCTFLGRFPFAMISLRDPDIPLEVHLTGWSPFIPTQPNNSSLPVAALEYEFTNKSLKPVDAVFSFNTKQFMATGDKQDRIRATKNGFVLWQPGSKENPWNRGGFCVRVDDDRAIVNHTWFRGGWFDSLSIAWKDIEQAHCPANPPVDGQSPGASIYVPFTVEPGAVHAVRVMLSWHVPCTNMRIPDDRDNKKQMCKTPGCCPTEGMVNANAALTYIPWYAGQFAEIEDVADYWAEQYDDLRAKSACFRDCFYDQTLPPEVIEAIAANLTILKSPTVLRQVDGNLWCFEGCSDSHGCCHGSCTHVWNYAQAICHLFPSLERTLRNEEFTVSQDERGHQTFRAALPIRPPAHNFHAASDGQLGGIMKVYREWRISGDTDWMKSLWPKVKQSLAYCIETWDPRHHGVLEEPHHNTYDIEFWGPDAMCTSFYLGALTAAADMGRACGDDVRLYDELIKKGRAHLETQLYNGEYLHQEIRWTGLDAKYKPLDDPNAPAEARELAQKEGPKYQYGQGCLSDAVLGFWIAQVCGLGEIADAAKVRNTLASIRKYNLKHDLMQHANPQRPAFAMGPDGGLLLCTWPKGGALSLPFVYSNEVWTGIEYQVASHCMFEGLVPEGLDIVRAARDRYDGRVRNPYDEYECGHWYARAMSSYGMIQGLTGVRYDAVNKTLYIDSRIGNNFKSFLSTETGFGTVGLAWGRPRVNVKLGSIDIQKVIVAGKEVPLDHCDIR